MSLDEVLMASPAAVELGALLKKLPAATEKAWDEVDLCLRCGFGEARNLVDPEMHQLPSLAVWNEEVPCVRGIVEGFVRENAVGDLLTTKKITEPQREAARAWMDRERAAKLKLWREWSSRKGFGEETSHVQASTAAWNACRRAAASVYVQFLMPWFHKYHAGDNEEPEESEEEPVTTTAGEEVEQDCEGCEYGSASQYEHTVKCIMSGKSRFCRDGEF
jgi:hypothetical protein